MKQENNMSERQHSRTEDVALVISYAFLLLFFVGLIVGYPLPYRFSHAVFRADWNPTEPLTWEVMLNNIYETSLTGFLMILAVAFPAGIAFLLKPRTGAEPSKVTSAVVLLASLPALFMCIYNSIYLIIMQSKKYLYLLVNCWKYPIFYSG